MFLILLCSTISWFLFFLLAFVPLRILIMNVLGFCSVDEQHEVISYEKSQRADLCFVQETNITRICDVPAFNATFFVSSFFSVTYSFSTGVGVVVLFSAVASRRMCSFDAGSRVWLFIYFIVSLCHRAI